MPIWRYALLVVAVAAVWIFIAWHEGDTTPGPGDITDASPPATVAPASPPASRRAISPAYIAPPPRATTTNVSTADLAAERAAHRTRLRRRGPSPQPFVPNEPAPPGVARVTYPSGDLQLMTWVSRDPADGKRHPAVVYLHGGLALGRDDWDETLPWREAGFVVLTPALRGENGNPGDHEWWYGEVDDAIAAGHYAAELPYVDADRVFVAGHSSGAAETMLAALLPSPFRAAASIGGYVHQGFFVTSPKYRETLPFDPADVTEARVRSPIHFAATLRCPLYAFVGSEDVIAQDRLDEFVRAARAAGRDCRRIDVAGDHHTSKAAAIRESVTLFLQK